MPVLPPPKQGDMYTTAEVAQIFSVSIATVRRLCDAGELPHIKFGGRIRFEAKALQTYVDERWKPGGGASH